MYWLAAYSVWSSTHSSRTLHGKERDERQAHHNVLIKATFCKRGPRVADKNLICSPFIHQRAIRRPLRRAATDMDASKIKKFLDTLQQTYVQSDKHAL